MTLRGPLLPALIFAIILTQVPFLFTLFYSFQSWNLLRPGSQEFAGLENYGKVFTDDLFRNAVTNTVVLTVLLPVISRTQFALPNGAQSPPQPVKTLPGRGTASKVTTVPRS